MRPDDDSFTGLDTAQRGRKPSGGAIYHLRVRTASRAKGQSARAACAYIERSAEYGRDAEEAAELVYTESGHMPGWANAEVGAASYWDAADLYERSNGRLYKSMDFALPLALDAEQQQDLAVTFAHHLTDAEQLPYTLAIHAGKGANPHCHLMISERGNDGLERSAEHWFKRYNAAEPEAGGARKSTALKPHAWLEETRAMWAEQTNAALKEAGRELEIDHRSLEAQGIERVPGIHLGPHVLEMEARGIQTERRQLALGLSQINAQIQQLREQLREEGREYGREREKEASPEAEPSPRDARGAEHGSTRGAEEPTAPAQGVAGGDDPAPSGVRPRGQGAEEGGGAGRGRGLEAGAGQDGTGESGGDPFAQRLGVHDEPPRRGAGEAPRSGNLGLDPGSVGNAPAWGDAQRAPDRGRGTDLPGSWAAELDLDAVDREAGQARSGAVGLSPEMGGGEAGRAEAGREESREQAGGDVDAAALATAQAQFAEADAELERAVRQFAEADLRLEGEAEEQRGLELEAKQAAREAEWKRRELEEEKGRGLGD